MTGKKNGHPKAATKTLCNHIKLSPRQERLARALLRGPLTREQADRITPCSNSPEYVRQLRHKLGLDLPCGMVPFVTKSGEKGFYGLYEATAEDQEVLQQVLEV